MGSANQIGLEVTLVIPLCPQTPPRFLRPAAVGRMIGPRGIWLSEALLGEGQAEGLGRRGEPSESQCPHL